MINMKKIAKIAAAISIAIFIIDWLYLGLKLLDNDYNITLQAYIGLASLIIYTLSILYIKFTNRCPKCKKMIPNVGKYCPYCGNETSK